MEDLKKVVVFSLTLLKVQLSVYLPSSLYLLCSLQLVDPVENRYKDEDARAQATNDLLKSIVDYRTAVDSLSPKDKELVIQLIGFRQRYL